MGSNKIKIEIEPSTAPYMEVRRGDKEYYENCPVFRRKKFDPHKISAEMLRDHCRKNELYMVPRFNTVLYLHFKGISEIENLEEYTGLKCLWLESNCISVIKGLDHLAELKCLFLHQNCIKEISGLNHLTELVNLNLSNNYISCLANLAHLPNLQTLTLTRNKLATADDIKELEGCLAVTSLDLSYNSLEGMEVVDVLARMKSLHVLNMTGNPLPRKTVDYRRNLLWKCTDITYLDSRPVTDRDRVCLQAWAKGGLEAERKERERLVKEEHDKIHQSMMSLIEDREKKLAERGIFTIEQEIEEIEKRNQELLDKVNEGRVNKIEKVEVYKADEFDDIEDKAPETEKTKGQEFAEHLKRQFAALDDEQVSVEDLIAIQDFEEAETEKHKKEEKRNVQKISHQISNEPSVGESRITEIIKDEQVANVEKKEQKEETSDNKQGFGEIITNCTNPIEDNHKLEGEITEHNQNLEEAVINNNEKRLEVKVDIPENNHKCQEEYNTDVLAMNEKNLAESFQETYLNNETTEIVTGLLNSVISQIVTDEFEKSSEVSNSNTIEDAGSNKSESCKFYEDCLCLEEPVATIKDTGMKKGQSVKETEKSKTDKESEGKAVAFTENIKTRCIESAVASSLSKSSKKDTTTTFLGSISDRDKLNKGIRWETIFKPKEVPIISSDADDDDENENEEKVEKKPSPKVEKKDHDDDSNQDILTRIMNNPDSINPFVADMIVKYWNRRMAELKSEQEKQKAPEKRLNLSRPKESQLLAGIKKSVDIEQPEQSIGKESVKEDEKDEKSSDIILESSSEETSPVKRSPKQFSLFKNKRFSHFKKHINQTYLDCQQQNVEEESLEEKEISQEEESKDPSSNDEMVSCNEEENEEETLTVICNAPNYPRKECPSELPKFKSPFQYDTTGPNLMEELQRLKKEEEDKKEKVFDKEERMKTLISQYKMENIHDDEDSSNEDDENDEKTEPKSVSSTSTKNIDLRSYSTKTFKGYNHRNYSKIGEKLQSYDFNDKGTERLFGYNLPEKFFFKEDKNEGVSHRQQRSIGFSMTSSSNDEQMRSSSTSKYACSGTSTNDLNNSEIFPNIQIEPKPKFVSCGTSSNDLPFTRQGTFKQDTDANLPKGLFMNCAELRDLLQKEDQEDFDGDERFYSPSTSPQPRFEEITDEEIKDLETQENVENERIEEEPFLMVHNSSLDKIDENFAKISPTLPSSMSEWRMLGDKMAAETDKKIKEIEEHIDNLRFESDEEEKPQDKNISELTSLKASSSIAPKRFTQAWNKEKEIVTLDVAPQPKSQGSRTRIFSQKLDVANEQTPAFLKLNMEEKEQSVKTDDKPKKILIEELDLD